MVKLTAMDEYSAHNVRPYDAVDLHHNLHWIDVEADGRWAQRYGPLGSGLNQVRVRTDDGREGTAIFELTGAHHHRYFPVARANELPG